MWKTNDRSKVKLNVPIKPLIRTVITLMERLVCKESLFFLHQLVNSHEMVEKLELLTFFPGLVHNYTKKPLSRSAMEWPGSLKWQTFEWAVTQSERATSTFLFFVPTSSSFPNIMKEIVPNERKNGWKDHCTGMTWKNA